MKSSEIKLKFDYGFFLEQGYGLPDFFTVEMEFLTKLVSLNRLTEVKIEIL